MCDKDVLARQAIVNNIDKNYFVEAGAGSGKTTMLVKRMVAMIESHSNPVEGIKVENIAAITFTKAAANEFYERFQALLLERCDYTKPYTPDPKDLAPLPAPTPESAKRCEEALKNIDLCFMGTIDSFCQTIISEHPYEAKLPSDTIVLSEDDANVIYRKMFVDICNGKFGAELKSSAETFKRFHRDPEASFVIGMNILLKNRNASFDDFNPVIPNIEKEFKNEKAVLLNVLGYIQSRRKTVEILNTFSEKQKKFAANFDYYIRLLNANWNYSLPDVMYALEALDDSNFQIVIDEYKSNIAYAKFFTPVKTRSGTSYYAGFSMVSDGTTLSKLKELKYEVSVNFWKQCKDVIAKDLNDRGYLTYSDFLYYLKKMLADDAKNGGSLIKHIRSRHSYFLLDEFQDTNPVSSDIFFYLSTNSPNVDVNLCVPEKGSLFIVGDPKQSIYRFNGADIEAFSMVKNRFVGNVGEVLYLSRNYRSTAKLRDYFNDVFSNMMPDTTNNQSKFELIPDIQPDPASPSGTKILNGVYTYKAVMKQENVENDLILNQDMISKIILNLVGNPNYKIIEKGVEREITFGDFMVLTSSKKNLIPIIEAFAANDIPVKTEGQVLFDSSKVLRAICDVYFALTNADDGSALYSVLTGEVFKHTKEELDAYVVNGGKLSLYRKKTDDAKVINAKLENDLDVFSEFKYKNRNCTPSALFSAIFESFENYKIFNAIKPHELEVVYYTQELLRSKEKSGILVSLEDGVAYLKALLAGESKEERCLSLSVNNNRVRLANMHKVKGLEAPIVIISADYNMGARPNTRFEKTGDSTKGYIFNLQDSNNNYRVVCATKRSNYDNANELEKEAKNAEVKRAMYVAATRARNALFIANVSRYTYWKELFTEVTNSNRIQEFKITDSYVYKKTVSPVTVSSEDCYKDANKDCVISKDKMEKTFSYKLPSKDDEKSLSKNSDDDLTVDVDDASVDDASSASDDNETEEEKVKAIDKYGVPANIFGTMAHRLMEIMVTRRNYDFDADAVISSVIEEFIPEEYEKGSAKCKNMLSIIADKMQNGGIKQKNKAPQDLLAEVRDADEVHCEMNFSYPLIVDGVTQIWRGVMDLVYRKGNKWYIIDYKTALVEMADFDEHYKRQLEAYKKAFNAITNGNEVESAMTYYLNLD